MASPDSLLVTLEMPDIFVSAADETMALELEPGHEFAINIPSQMSLELAAKVEQFNKKIDKPITLVSQVTLVVNIALAYGLKHMWSMMNIL